MNEHIISFCNDWLSKAESYDNTTLNGVFDRYFTLFMTYNALYGHATRTLIDNGTINQKDFGDKKGATDNMIVFLGVDQLHASLQNNWSSVMAIVTRLNHNGFYLYSKLRYNTPDYAKDENLKNDIQSQVPKISCHATLTLLYQLRCNLFHGQKSYHMNQIDILGPANTVLIGIIYTILNKLQNEA